MIDRKLNQSQFPSHCRRRKDAEGGAIGVSGSLCQRWAWEGAIFFRSLFKNLCKASAQMSFQSKTNHVLNQSGIKDNAEYSRCMK